MIGESATAVPTPEEIARVVYEESAAVLRHMPGGIWPGWEHLSWEQRRRWLRYGRGKQLRHFPAALRAMAAVPEGVS